MAELNHYINWKAARGQEGGISFQRIHIKPGLYFHRIFQIKTDGSDTQYIHTYQKVNDNYFDVNSSCYYVIKGPNNENNYVPDGNSSNISQLPNTDNKSTMSGKHALTERSNTLYGVGSFKIVEVKSDEGRPYDFD